MTCLQATDINEKFRYAVEQITVKIDDFVRNGSGWIIHHFEHIDLGVFKYDPLRASSYFKLSKAAANKKACINIRNNDENVSFGAY